MRENTLYVYHHIHHGYFCSETTEVNTLSKLSHILFLHLRIDWWLTAPVIVVMYNRLTLNEICLMLITTDFVVKTSYNFYRLKRYIYFVLYIRWFLCVLYNLS